MTGSDLARAVGWTVNGRMSQRLIRGQATVGKEKAELIAKWLGVPVALLFREVMGSSKVLFEARMHDSDWTPPW